MPEESLADQKVREQALIERTRVPELEVLLLQQQLNALVRAGRLSLPTLVENGQADALTKAKQRERDALQDIEQASIPAQRPTDYHEAEAAQAADGQVLERVRMALAAIPDAAPGAFHDHKASSRQRVAELEAQYRRKWGAQARLHARLEALMAQRLRRGALLAPDGGFDYTRLMPLLEELQAIALAVSAAGESQAALAADVRQYERLVWLALQDASAGPDAAMVPAEPDSEAIRELIAPARGARIPAPVVTTETDEERHAREAALDATPFDVRLRDYGDWVRAGRTGDAGASLAASLMRTHPEDMDEQWITHIDAAGMASVLAIADAAWLRRLPEEKAPRVLAALRHRTGADGAHAQLAGRVAATVLAQDPSAHLPLLQDLLKTDEPVLLLALVGNLSDADVVKLPKSVIMSLCKTLGGGTTPEQRRQMSRLVRLAK